MKMSRQLCIATVLLCSIALQFLNVFIVKCEPNTIITDYYCSADKYDPDSGYGAEIDGNLVELTSNTCNQPNNQYTLTGTYTVASASCQVNLGKDDCISCLGATKDFLTYGDCQYSVSAYVVMVDCEMTYAPRTA